MPKVKRLKQSLINYVSRTSAVRDVHRSIVETPDGTIRTTEHERSLENCVLQQTEMSRELECAKESFTKRLHADRQTTFETWCSQRYTAKLAKRATVALRMVNSMLNGQSDLANFLAVEAAVLKGTVNDYRKCPADRLEEFVNLSGSQCFIMAVKRNLLFKKRLLYANGFMERLAREEIDHVPLIRKLGPGIYEKSDPPHYPMTPAEVEAALLYDQECISSADPAVYADFVETALETNGDSPTLLVPFIEQLIPSLILSKLHQKCPSWVLHASLPRLLEISDVTEQAVTLLPFHPCAFFGGASTAQFGVCVFEIGGELYENVHVEMPILVRGYPQKAESEYFRITGAKVTRQMDEIMTPEEMLARFTDRVPELSRLRQLKHVYDEVRHKTEKHDLLTKQNVELAHVFEELRAVVSCM